MKYWFLRSLTFVLGVVVTAATTILSTKYSIVGHAIAQVSVGILSYLLGVRFAVRSGRKWRGVLLVVSVFVVAYGAAGILSPTGDPFSFLLMSVVEIGYALSAFWLGRREGREQQLGEEGDIAAL